MTSTSLTVTETEIVTTTEEETTSTTEVETTTEVTTTETTEVTTTEEQTQSETRSSTSSAEGEAPWRPTITSELTSETSNAGDTQTGCPTGFYGCLATHGGGCCRTDRDCETHSCPAPSSTTIVSDGVTVVVAADDVPATTTSTCANGWFLCGDSGGPVAGCCPSGYSCGTASCFTVQASETQEVQKELPDNGASRLGSAWVLSYITLAMGPVVLMLI